MTWRWGPGPVFAMELRSAARRWQTFAGRAGYTTVLLAAVSVVWFNRVSDPKPIQINDMARMGEWFYYALVGSQLVLLLLAAPAATAGAVCLDKTRGSLLHVLVTDLSNAEIVLGKLAARLVPVFGLLLAGLPILGIAVLLGGIEPWSVFGAFLVCLGVAILGCSLAIALSVWGSKTHDVLLATYCLIIVALVACPVWCNIVPMFVGPGAVPQPAWLWKSNPFWLAFAPYARPGSIDLQDTIWFLVEAFALSFIMTVLAIVTVRYFAIRHGAAIARPRRRWRLWAFRWRLPGPSLDGNPVLWREWHRRQPSRWLRVIWTFFGLSAILASATSIILDMSNSQFRDFAALTNGFIATIGLLLFSVSAVTSLYEERVRGSLDVLLTTPLSTRTIVWGKWWATYRTIGLLALLPTINMGALLLYNVLCRGRCEWMFVPIVVGLFLAYGAALTSLGLALSTWLARVSRSAAWCAFGYGIMLFLPPMLALGLVGDNEHGISVVIGCPLWGVGMLSQLAVEPPFHRPFMQYAFAGGIAWIVVYFTIAGVLLAATLATFDRCLGRVEQRSRPPAPPAKRPAPLAEREEGEKAAASSF